MKLAFLAGALVAALASRQDPPQETAADLDQRAAESLKTKVPVVKGLTLPMLFFMNEELHDIQVYADPVAIPKMDDIKTAFDGEVSLDEVLDKTLKAKGLLHLVWQGMVVMTDEKGRKAIQEADWTGLTQKGLKEHSELAKKMNSAFIFKYDAYEPREALKEFSKVSGVAIKTDALAKLEVKREKRGMISPDRTTFWGALVCLARTTGITYEFSKDGGLVAKPPPKK